MSLSPSPTVEELDAEIERLQAERRRLAAAKWIALIPADAGERLRAMAEEAAAGVTSNYANVGSESWEIAPGVSLYVTFDTDIADEEDSE